MNIPKLVIFDMDGLIFDTEHLFMHFKTQVMKRYGYVNTLEDYVQTLGTAGEQLQKILLELYGPDYPANAISQETRHLLNQYVSQNGLEPKQGIPELLQYFSDLNIPCCVASSSQKETVSQYLERASLASYFSYIVGGNEVKNTKPAPDIFLKACEHFNCLPANALVLEDSSNGILAADAAGIPVICIPDLVVPSNDIIKKTAAVVPTAADLLKYFS